jgi:hypothetical protein
MGKGKQPVIVLLPATGRIKPSLVFKSKEQKAVTNKLAAFLTLTFIPVSFRLYPLAFSLTL